MRYPGRQRETSRGAFGRRRSAFTLLEMLLATMLISAIVAAAYEMYIGSLKTYRAGSETMDLYQTARAVLSAMAGDLRSTVYTRGDFGFGLTGTDGGEEEPAGDLLELSCLGAVRWREEPTAFDAEPLPPRADFRHVTYRVLTPEEAAEEDTAEVVTPVVGLVREVRYNLTGTDAEEREVQVLSRRVVWLDLEYYDGSAWVADWNASAVDALPLAVRITLAVIPREVDLAAESAAGGETAPPAGAEAILPEAVAQAYPDAKVFTTVVDLPAAVMPEGSRVMGLP